MTNPFLLAEDVRPIVFRPGLGGTGKPSSSSGTTSLTGAPKLGSTAPPQKPAQTKAHNNIISRAARTVLRQAKLNQRAKVQQAKAAKAAKTESLEEQQQPLLDDNITEAQLIVKLKEARDTKSLPLLLAVCAHPSFPYHQLHANVFIRELLRQGGPFHKDRVQVLKKLVENPGLELAMLENSAYSVSSFWVVANLQEPKAVFGHPLKTWSFEKLLQEEPKDWRGWSLTTITHIDLFPLNTALAILKMGQRYQPTLFSIASLREHIATNAIVYNPIGIYTLEDLLKRAD